MFKAVLFDLDGVICDTAKFHYLAWKKLANELGGDIDEEFNETLKGVDREESLLRILKHIGVELSDEDMKKYMDKKNNWYIDMLSNLSKKDILPGIEKFISDLKANNIKIAIASASKNAPKILKQIEIIQYVDTIADPSDVKQNKPAPDIFLLAAQQVGCKNNECIGIEDSQAGIDSLNKAKIKSIGIGNLTGSTILLKDTSKLTLKVIQEAFEIKNENF